MRFLEVIGGWINEHFSNEEAIYLVVLLLVGFAVLFFFGAYIAPVLAGLIFAFLLSGLVDRLVAWHVPRLAAVWIVFALFAGGAVALVIGIAPLIWRQLTELVNAMPGVIDRLRVLTGNISSDFPGIFSPMAADSWLAALNAELTEIGKVALQGLVAQVPNIFAIIIYLILLPISVFFFLKDGKRMVARALSLLPRHRTLLDSVGREMNEQIANYIRGKSIEILIVGTVTYIAFLFLGLNYAALLGFIVGISVLVPFVGAAVVTVPVAAVGFLQYGWSWISHTSWPPTASSRRWTATCSCRSFFPRRTTCTRSRSSWRCWRSAGCGGSGASSSPFPSQRWSRRSSTPGRAPWPPKRRRPSPALLARRRTPVLWKARPGFTMAAPYSVDT